MNQIDSTSLTFDQAIVQCTKTLQSKYDVENSLNSLLKILGEFYQSDSSYIFEFDEEEQVFANHYQWHHAQTDSIAAQFGNLPFSTLEYFSGDRVFSEDVTVLTFETKLYPDLPLSKLFSVYDIENIMIFPIIRQGKTTGFVSITNTNLDALDVRLFPCVVLFVQECLHKREMHKQISHLHYIDPLTGCFNETKFQKQIYSYAHKQPESLGILFIQLTGLEKTSEIYGEKYVDMKIKLATLVMGQFFSYPFYRIGPHKFLSFVANISESSFVSLVEQLRLEAASNSDACFTVGHTWSGDGVDIYKEIARSNSFIQSKDTEDTIIEERSPTECLQEDLLRAMVHDDFIIYLQPKVLLATGKVVGAEALVRRIVRKTGKLVTPDTFVPLYEHHAIISYLDMHVLKQVCEILAHWREMGHELVPISVNFSRVTLMEDGIGEQIVDMCQQYDIPLHCLEIEITERLGNRDDDLSTLVADDFRKLGLTLVLDDFGSTYSNFLTLTKVHIDVVKIDHSLVDDMLENGKNQKLLQSIVNMCHSIGGISSVAEGIETKEQSDMLKAMDCTYGQGFYFSKPLSKEIFYQEYISGT